MIMGFLCFMMPEASGSEIWRLKGILLLQVGVIWGFLYMPGSWSLVAKTSAELLAIIPSHGLSICLFAWDSLGFLTAWKLESNSQYLKKARGGSVCYLSNLPWKSHTITSIIHHQVKRIRDMSKFMGCQGGIVRNACDMGVLWLSLEDKIFHWDESLNWEL